MYRRGSELDVGLMEPHDWRWGELIFPWCADVALLLRLRAVCRAFRCQLDGSRLWLPITSSMSRLRYDERLVGWRGVVHAMKREEHTRRNCRNGTFALGPTLHVPRAELFFVVAGRVAIMGPGCVQLFDLETGDMLVSFELGSMSLRFPDHVVLDRWIPFTAEDSRGLLLDCVEARLVEFAPPNPRQLELHISVAGAFISHQIPGVPEVVVARLASGSDGSTVVTEVARLALSSCNSRVAMGERGQSYLLFDSGEGTLELIDMATRTTKRVYTPRE